MAPLRRGQPVCKKPAPISLRMLLSVHPFPLANKLYFYVNGLFSCPVVKLHRMAPETHDHNIIVTVLEKQTIVDKERPDGTRIREENVLIADETGCMYLTSRGSTFSLLWRWLLPSAPFTNCF